MPDSNVLLLRPAELFDVSIDRVATIVAGPIRTYFERLTSAAFFHLFRDDAADRFTTSMRLSARLPIMYVADLALRTSQIASQ
jgi:hypothetical protein